MSVTWLPPQFIQELFLYKRELLNRPKMLIVTKLDRKGATGRYQAFKHKLNSIHEHGKSYYFLELYSDLADVASTLNDFQCVRKLRGMWPMTGCYGVCFNAHT